jgi:hypothetical protein
VREVCDNNQVVVCHIPREKQLADILTKFPHAWSCASSDHSSCQPD